MGKSSEFIEEFEEEAGAIAAEAEAKAKSWFGRALSWFKASPLKTKATVIVGVVIAGYVIVSWAGSFASGALSTARSYVPSVSYSQVSKTDLEKVREATKATVAEAVNKASADYQQKLDALQKRVDVVAETLDQVGGELQATMQAVSQLQSPKKPEASKIATGSIESQKPKSKPKPRAFDITDPSTWPSP